MKYVNKKRMAINESKVVELLRNSHLYRAKIVEEESTFEKELMNTQMENGVLSYLNEAAAGELRELIVDLGIRDDTIPFMNLAQLNKLKEQNLFESDSQIRVFKNALFTPLDMTDYEEQFVSWQELPGSKQPINHPERLNDLRPEAWPQINALIEKAIPENPPLLSTGPTMTALLEADRAEPEEEEEDEDEDEGDGEYGDEYGEEGEEEEAEYGDYGAEAEEEEIPPWGKPEREWPAKDILESPIEDNRAFRGPEKLRQKFTLNEIDGFMKLLAIKPKVQWEDRTRWHYKLGLHEYHDGNQMHDPDYHLTGEVERQEADYKYTRVWREGSEVRFVVGDKRPDWSKRYN